MKGALLRQVEPGSPLGTIGGDTIPGTISGGLLISRRSYMYNETVRQCMVADSGDPWTIGGFILPSQYTL